MPSASRPSAQTRRRSSTSLVTCLVVSLVLLAACGGSGREARDVALRPPDPVQPGPATVLAVGDIASCDHSEDEATAAIVAGAPGDLLTLGDAVYDNGSPSEYQRCYEPSWGPLRARTRPTPGNHDYHDKGARGYFDYFGAQAGEPGKGWYSYDLAGWHLIALNSSCGDVGGCQPGSQQERWLRADLAAHPARCTLAFWHHPRFSSGRTHGSNTEVAGLWQALYDSGADVVLSGHEHSYERFGTLNPTGDPDPARGIREFVVGTGGRSHYPFGSPLKGSEMRNDDTYGALRMTLRPGGYDWRFLPVPGASFADSGSAECR